MVIVDMKLKDLQQVWPCDRNGPSERWRRHWKCMCPSCVMLFSF